MLHKLDLYVMFDVQREMSRLVRSSPFYWARRHRYCLSIVASCSLSTAGLYDEVKLELLQVVLGPSRVEPDSGRIGLEAVLITIGAQSTKIRG